MQTHGKIYFILQWARKLKNVQAKKTRKIKINQFHEIFFDQISFLAISNMAKINF